MPINAVHTSASVIPFPRRAARRDEGPSSAVLRVVEPPSTDPRVEVVADMAREMDLCPWIAPVVRVVRGLDRRARVHVAVGCVAAALSVSDARLLAATLRADPGQPGNLTVARDLDRAALSAERQSAVLVREPLRPEHGLALSLSAAAMAVAALLLAGAAALFRAG